MRLKGELCDGWLWLRQRLRLRRQSDRSGALMVFPRSLGRCGDWICDMKSWHQITGNIASVSHLICH